MAFFKEPLHNVNDITVMGTKFTTGDINIEFHRFTVEEKQECPKQLRPVNPSYYAGTTIHDIVVYKDAIHIFGGYDDYYLHLAYTEKDGVSSYEWYNDLPLPFIHSKAIAAGNELYLIGLSGAFGQSTTYGNILLYDDERDSFSLYDNYDLSFEFADAVCEFNERFKAYLIYIYGGATRPNKVRGIFAKNKGTSSEVQIPLNFNNDSSHVIIFKDHYHIFGYDETNNLMMHYYHYGPAGGEEFTRLSNFTVDKITNVLVIYGKLYAFTYHSGIYVWNENDDTWSLVDNTITNNAFFYPHSVVLYKNKVHVFNWAPNKSSYNAYHTELESLYVLGLGDTQ